jgi:hypothetical protein
LQYILYRRCHSTNPHLPLQQLFYSNPSLK